MNDLIERLRAVKWEVTDDCDRMPDDPTHKCVFVDMRPDDFRALLLEAAAALEAAREDAERYRWLRTMAREQLLNPKMASSEYPDMRTYWRLPTLICSGPVGGFVEFDAAIDQARGKGGQDEA